MARYLLEALCEGTEDEILFNQFLETARTAPRRQAFYYQLRAEAVALLGRREQALLAIEGASACGLVDLLWLDRCPLLHELREHPRFVELRSEVAERARSILAEA